MNYREQVLFFYKKYRSDGHRPNQALRIAKYSAKYDEHSHKRNVLPSQHNAYDEEQDNRLPNGWYWKVKFEHDSDHERPEEWDDGRGITSWERRSLEKWEHGWVLVWDRYSPLLYDYKASLEKALKDGWDAPPYHTGTKLEQATRAVKQDYDYLRGYYNQDWWYVGMIVELYDEDDHLIDEDSCWGYESNCMDYLCSEARSWAARMIKDARRTQREERHAARVASRFYDAMECGV